MGGISSTINRNLVLPVYYWKSGDRRLLRFKELEQSQWFSKETLEKLQIEKLRKLIEYSYRHTEYYRQLFDQEGIKPEDIRSRDDLRHVPVLTKSIIQEHGNQMISDAFSSESLIADASGGSTGVPTNFFKDIERHRLRRADQYRHDQWCGWKLGEPYALLWGAQRDLSIVQSIKQKAVARFVDRAFMFDAFAIREDEFERTLQRLRKIRPTMIIAYANALYLFARQLQESGLGRLTSLRGIVSSAETLSQDKRIVIERSMGCKVLNRYGSREVGLIASECDRQEGLHINSENVIVEVLRGDKDAGVGERGEIVVTDLSNFGMPFIRYRMGDNGYLSGNNCSCGRNFPLLGAVEGRVSDFFVAADGTLVHGEFYSHLFYGLPQIKKFQLIQESMARVTVRIVSNDGVLGSVLSPIIDEIVKSLGPDVEVQVQYCDDIPPTPSGKYLFTISKVAS